MNLPNKLTTLRFLLVPVFIIFVELAKFSQGDKGYNYLIALVVFSVASFTDFLDGSIARKYNLVTDFGKFMDPLADKVLVITAMVYLVTLDLCSPIVLVLVLTREFAVSGIRMIAATSQSGGKVIAASMAGKIKTVLQMVTIIISFAYLSCIEIGVISASTLLAQNINLGINISMWIIALVTIISGIQYILPNIDLIKNAK